MTSYTWLVSNCQGSNEMHRRRKVLNIEGVGWGWGWGEVKVQNIEGGGEGGPNFALVVS